MDDPRNAEANVRGGRPFHTDEHRERATGAQPSFDAFGRRASGGGDAGRKLQRRKAVLGGVYVDWQPSAGRGGRR